MIQNGNLVFITLDLTIKDVTITSTTAILSNLPKSLKDITYIPMFDQTNGKWIVGRITPGGTLIPGYTSNRINGNMRIMATVQYICADVD